ncbi:IS701 family transposase [Streptomyces sp. NPDC058812]
MSRIGGRFARVEPRLRARQLVLGLLADLPRKNCWTIAEHTGDTSPDGHQHLLGRAKWDADLVRDDLRAFVLEYLTDDQAVLVMDETGDLKKGNHTVGVQRQYTGTAGRIENAQVAVYLTYTSRHGHAAIDRALYLPKSWTIDPERCRQAAVPDGVDFATKPQLARQMIERALDAGVPAAWAAGDEVYGDNPHLRAAWSGGSSATCSRSPALTASRPRPDPSAPTTWPRRSPSGPGRSCPPDEARRATAGTTGRRSPSPPPAWPAISTCWSAATTGPAHSPTTAAIHPARSRCPPWSRSPEAAGRSKRRSRTPRPLAGLDEHQVRRWDSWHRWVTLPCSPMPSWRSLPPSSDVTMPRRTTGPVRKG